MARLEWRSCWLCVVRRMNRVMVDIRRGPLQAKCGCCNAAGAMHFYLFFLIQKGEQDIDPIPNWSCFNLIPPQTFSTRLV